MSATQSNQSNQRGYASPLGKIKSGYDIVIVARPSAKDSDYGKFESAIFHLLNLHHLLKDDDLE